MFTVLTVWLLSGAGAAAQTAPITPSPLPTATTPPQPAPLVEHLRPVRPADVKLGWNNRHWQLTQDGQVLKDFGTREQDARQALRLVQQLQLDQYGTVGSPPVMEYWLSGGGAPQARGRLELRPATFDAASLQVAREQGRWCLRDKTRVLFEFAGEADAGQALAVIRKYHFDEVGVVGQAVPMHVFLGKPGDSMPAGRQEVPRFSRLAKNNDGTPKKQAPTASPFAGLPQAGLPSLARPTPAPTGPLAPTLNGRQAPLWREKSQQAAAMQQAGPPAERVAFDWRRVEIKQDGADWKLVTGGQVLANFGANAQEARLALAAVKHYRFTEEHRVGGERPVVGYCTASLMSPRGVMLGLYAQPLTLDQLQVQHVGEGFALCSGSQVVMKLGERREEADRLLEVIKSNKYDRLCQLGEPGKQGLALLVRSR